MLQILLLPPPCPPPPPLPHLIFGKQDLPSSAAVEAPGQQWRPSPHDWPMGHRSALVAEAHFLGGWEGVQERSKCRPKLLHSNSTLTSGDGQQLEVPETVRMQRCQEHSGHQPGRVGPDAGSAQTATGAGSKTRDKSKDLSLAHSYGQSKGRSRLPALCLGRGALTGRDCSS